MARRKPSLIEAMADNSDLTLQARITSPIIEEPTHAGRHTDTPVLDEAITALLVMAGCTVKWDANYWLVIDKNGRRSGASKNASFDEWRSVLNYLAGGTPFGESA